MTIASDPPSAHRQMFSTKVCSVTRFTCFKTRKAGKFSGATMVLSMLAILLLAVPAFAQTPPAAAPQAAKQPPAVQLKRAETRIEEISKALRNDDTTDEQLQAMRARLTPVLQIMQEAVDTLTANAEAAKKRLEQLGPEPKPGEPAEAKEISDQRQALTKAYAEADTLLKRAKVARVRIDELAREITNTRREILQDTLFKDFRSALNPYFLYEAITAVPETLSRTGILISGWPEYAAYQLSEGYWLRFAGVVVALSILAWLLRLLALRFFRRHADIHDASPFVKTRNAIWAALLIFAIPTVIAAAFFEAMRYFELIDATISPLANALFETVQHIAIAAGLGSGLLAPSHPNWRLIDIDTSRAKRLFWLVIHVVCIVEVTRILDVLIVMTASPLVVSQLVAVIRTLAVAIVIATTLYGTSEIEEQMDAELGPMVGSQPAYFGTWRILIWLAISGIATADVLGYLNLADFIVTQLVWITFVFSAAYMLTQLTDAVLSRAKEPGSLIGKISAATLGLHDKALDQGAILIGGFVKLSVWTGAAIIALVPLGFETDSIFDSMRTAFLGFSVGGVKISLATILMTLVLLVGGYFITRSFQHWLEYRYLPSTSLDHGLQNSISTSAGYVGVLAVIAFALSYMGLNFEKLAFVAGALSLGIGFGLQAIVSNFVSGLILLWERSIKVGDWVIVGDEEGHVRRINVRSTEIETFDRQIVIIPNSNLISGVVKNWVRNNTIGRVIVAVGVGYESDPELVRNILLECAKSHELIMDDPPPRVVFADFGDSSLNFELRCYVSNVDSSMSVRSHLRFEIFRRLKQASIEIPFPQRDLNIRNVESIVKALRDSKPGDGGSEKSAPAV